MDSSVIVGADICRELEELCAQWFQHFFLVGFVSRRGRKSWDGS